MSQPDPLFDMRGPSDVELARLERELGSLRWRGDELPAAALVDAPNLAAREATRLSQPAPRSSEANESRPWRLRVTLPWIAGLVSAAAVLAVAYAMRAPPPAPERVPAPLIQPAGSPPTAPELRDPFTNREHDAPTSSPDLRDPFAPRPNAKTPTAPTHSDLVDPFEDDRDASWTPPSTRAREPQPQLIDPFASPRDPMQSDLRDPFAERSDSRVTSPKADEPASRSPDLVDPFTRPH